MDDLISRQEAIDALENIFNRCEEINQHLPDGDPDKDDYKMYPDYLIVLKYLNQGEDHDVDFVQVVRGHWIEVDDDLISGKCSVCGWESHLYEDDVVGMDFCPNCGARLQEGEEDE